MSNPHSIIISIAVLAIMGFSTIGHSAPLENVHQAWPVQLEQANRVNYSANSAYLKDDTNALTLSEALRSDSWQKSQVDHLNFGFSDSTYWLAVQFDNQKTLLNWYIRLRYTLFDRITVYICESLTPNDPSDCQSQQLGDQLTFDQRAFYHPEFVAQLPFGDEPNHWVILKIKTKGSYPFIISVSDKKSLTTDLLVNFAIQGGYISMMFVMGLYNLFLFFSTRDRSYFYYSAFVLSFLIFHMCYTSTAFQFFWPNTPSINQYALPITFSINLVFLNLFIPKFLDLARNGIKSHYLFRFYLGISVFILIGNLFIPYQLLVKLQNLTMLTCVATALAISTRFWIAGIGSARFFTIAWLAFIVGLALTISRSLGLIPLTEVSFNSYQLGSFFEIILLSLALGERISQLQKDKLEGRRALLKSKEESIQHLKSYEDLYNHSLAGQFQLNQDHKIIKSNPSWDNAIGVSNGEVINFDQLFKYENDLNLFWDKVQKKSAIQGFVAEFSNQSNSQSIFISLTIRKGIENDGAHWIGSAQDVTERYLQDESYKQLQNEKTQSLKQLVMGFSHEMNTPLGNIKVAESFVQEEINKLSDEAQPALKDGMGIINQGVHHLEELSALMKASVAVRENFKKERIDLKAWLHAWSKNIKLVHQNLKITLSLSDDLNDWDIYPVALEQVLNHLVENTVLHNENLYSEGVLTTQLTVTIISNHIYFLYCDNGVGLDEETKNSIFLPFYTTKRQQATNKGLGLYQTYNLITESLSGQINWPAVEAGFSIEMVFDLN